MAKIYAHNKQFTGVRAGVTFVNGVGETDDKAALEWFKRREGYSIGKDFAEKQVVESKADEESMKAKPAVTKKSEK